MNTCRIVDTRCVGCGAEKEQETPPQERTLASQHPPPPKKKKGFKRKSSPLSLLFYFLQFLQKINSLITIFLTLTPLPSPKNNTLILLLLFFIYNVFTESSPLTHTITLPSQPSDSVQIIAAPGISPSEFRSAIESSLFQQWLKNLQAENGALTDAAMSLNKVLIQGVDYFGNRVGFVKFKADIVDKEMGKKVPGIVFAQGPAVTILILLESEGETYAVLKEQVRVPTGRFVLELPAGMLDDDKGDFVGTAVREFSERSSANVNKVADKHELDSITMLNVKWITYKKCWLLVMETGIHLNIEDMVDPTAFLDPSTGRKVFPSPGGCDEEISVFLYKGQVSKEIIQQRQGKQTGLHDHGELIKVHVVPYAQLWRSTADAKVLMAIALYEMATREGLLPKP